MPAIAKQLPRRPRPRVAKPTPAPPAKPRVVIALGCGMCITPAAYLSALRAAKANPDATFKRSFTSDWVRATGREIVAEYRRMLAAKWAAQHVAPGKGNKARKRAEAIANAKANCKWCGTLTGDRKKAYCCADCQRCYYS